MPSWGFPHEITKVESNREKGSTGRPLAWEVDQGCFFVTRWAAKPRGVGFFFPQGNRLGFSLPWESQKRSGTLDKVVSDWVRGIFLVVRSSRKAKFPVHHRARLKMAKGVMFRCTQKGIQIWESRGKAGCDVETALRYCQWLSHWPGEALSDSSLICHLRWIKSAAQASAQTAPWPGFLLRFAGFRKDPSI